MDEDDNIESSAPRAATQEKKGPGIMGLILALLVSTVLGVGGGAMLALNQVETIAAAEKKKATEVPQKVDDALAWNAQSTVVDLDPVITNLAAPAETWLRLETAIVVQKEKVDDVDRLKAEAAASILAFARTLTVNEVQGASALNHLRDDLNDHVRFQSQDAVEELIIKAMILQ